MSDAFVYQAADAERMRASERLGARHRVDSDANRQASHHGEHTQTTQATAWADRYNSLKTKWQSGQNLTFEESESEQGRKLRREMFGSD